jgi:hypothetical protein
VTDEPAVRGGIEGYPTGLTWYQHHRAARVIASAATDATDCAMLLAVLGIHPGDGFQDSSPAGVADLARSGSTPEAVGLGVGAAESGVRRRRKIARWTRD